MRRVLTTFLLGGTLAISVGCATSKHQKPPEKVPVVKSQKEMPSMTPEQIMAKLDARMEKMRDEALKAGPEAVRYLASDLFIKAADASVRGDSQTAAFLFGHILKLSPDDIYLQKKYAIELIRIGELDKSLPVLSKLFKANPKDETIGLILGGVETSMGEKIKARQTYNTILKHFPKSEEACVFLAKSYGEEEKFKQAYALLNKCEKRVKGKGIYSYYKGKLAILEKKKDKAYRFFSKALKINPDYYQAAMAKGLIHEEKEEFLKAISTYKKFLKKNPMSYPILSRVVQVLFMTRRSPQEIIPFAERLSALDPNDLNLKARLGILYSDQKRFKDAEGVFKEILVAIPNSDKVLYYLGSLYRETGEYENAIEYYSKVDETSSLFHDSSIQIAQLLNVLAESDSKKYGEKFVGFVSKKIESHDSLKVDLGMLLASYYESNNKVEDAIEVLVGVRAQKNYSDGHEYYLASLYEKVKDYSSSRKLIRDLLEKNPRNPHALNFLGYSYLETEENMDEAFMLITQALSLKPDDGYIRDSLGWYYYKIGNYEKALTEIQKAWKQVKSDVVITKHLALIYQKLQKYDEAKKYFFQALRNCKLPAEKQELLQAIDTLESLRLPASAQ